MECCLSCGELTANPKYCSMSCASKHKANNSFRIKSKRLKDTYNKQPKYCRKCDSILPYEKRKNLFCSSSCSATFNNKKRGLVSNKIKKKIQKTLPVNEIKSTKISWCIICRLAKSKDSPNHKSTWCNINKIRTTRLIATTFNIKLGANDTLAELDAALDTLTHFYHNKKNSSGSIKKIFGFACSISNVTNMLKSLGIKRRTLSEALQLAVEFNRITLPASRYPYKNGWHTDWQEGKHFYRSSYELSFYEELDQDQMVYETENLRIRYFDSIKNKSRIAIPDIVIEQTIYEIKGDYTYNRQNMIDKFAAYKENGYSLILILEKIKYYIDKINDFPDQNSENILMDQ